MSQPRNHETTCASGQPPGTPLRTRGETACALALAQVAIGGEVDGAPAFEPAIGPHYRGSYGMMVRVFAE